MGKTRKTKNRAAKVNPVGIPSVRDINLDDELENGAHPEGAITLISDQLQSASIEDKMIALQSMTFLSTNRGKALAMLEENVVKIAAPLLMDANKNIRNAVAGALRTMSEGGLDVCVGLVEQDILTPLLALLNEYACAGDWTPVIDRSVAHVEQLDHMSDTFLQAVHLVLNLCERDVLALEHFNQTNILQSFVRYLDYKTFGIHIAIAVGQCLLVISEDNPVAWRILNQFSQELIFLLNIEDNHQTILLRTLSAAILSNVPALASAHINQIFATITVALDINHRQLLGKLTSSLPLGDNENKNAPEIEVIDEQMDQESEEEASSRRRRQDLPTAIESESEEVGWVLEAQRIAAETVTNLSSTNDDETNIDDDDLSDAESVHDYDHDSSGSSGAIQNDKLPIEILEPIKSLGLVEKLWQRGQPIAENVSQLLKENNRNMLKKVNMLRVSSLLSLQNLCNTMIIEDLGGAVAIYNVWLDVGQQVFQLTSSQDEEILEASTGLMRAALDHLRTSPELFTQMSANDLEMILSGTQNCTVSEIRANWLRMLGVLGCLLQEAQVKVILEFIVEQCFKETDAWTLSEAIDALMDIFSDNDWNRILYELNLAQKTKALEKILKNKLRQQKKELADRYLAVCTVRTNFSRFVKYVETEQRKYKP